MIAARTIYLNGELTAADDAALPVEDWGVLYGLGFFETFRTCGGRPHHWRYHRERLERACAAAGIAVPPTYLARDETRLRDTVAALLRNHGWDEGVFRYTLTAGRGTAGRFDQPGEFLVARPLPASAPPDGIVLRVLGLTRDNGEFLPRPKSLNYANALLGAQELRRRGAAESDEGLFLARHERHVVETARQNVVWFENERLCFPDPDLGAVAGTCLQWVREIVPSAVPRRVPLDGLLAADAIVVVNAVRGVTPVREVRDEQDRLLRTFPSASHPRVAVLRERWSAALVGTSRP